MSPRIPPPLTHSQRPTGLGYVYKYSHELPPHNAALRPPVLPSSDRWRPSYPTGAGCLDRSARLVPLADLPEADPPELAAPATNLAAPQATSQGSVLGSPADPEISPLI